MIVALFLSLLPWPCTLPTSVSVQIHSVPDDPELDAKIAAAGRDIAKLLELAASFAGGPQNDSAIKVYKRVLELDAGNEAAHKGLRHQLYDKKWFESFAELSKFKREEAAKMKEKGLARFKDEWVPEADVPFLNMGWAKDEDGVWTDPVEAARAKQVEAWKAAGCRFRADDNSWIAPEDTEKWAAIQWKCGEQWLDTAAANEYHSKIGKWWELAGEHFTIWSTCEWEGGNSARWYAEKCYPELVRVFGIEPKQNPRFIVLNSLAQYNQAAGGTPPLIPESEGISSLHGAYFADLYFVPAGNSARFQGAGVSFWDRKDAKLAGWGPYFLRWAAGQSFVESIDPSWTAIGEKIASGDRGDNQSMAAFWSEKKIPRWLRYGAASYVERFMKNPEAAEGADPWTLRAFAFGELKKAGGLRKLDDVFAFAINSTDIAGSGRLYQEAGLLVSFLLDGAVADKGLSEKHAAFKTALKSGSKADVAAAAVALQVELQKHDADIRKFAGL